MNVSDGGNVRSTRLPHDLNPSTPIDVICELGSIHMLVIDEQGKNADCAIDVMVTGSRIVTGFLVQEPVNIFVNILVRLVHADKSRDPDNPAQLAKVCEPFEPTNVRFKGEGTLMIPDTVDAYANAAPPIRVTVDGIEKDTRGQPLNAASPIVVNEDPDGNVTDCKALQNRNILPERVVILFPKETLVSFVTIG